MEYSTIGLIVWILAVALMVVTFIYCMCKGSGGIMSFSRLHSLEIIAIWKSSKI